jgi:hypothetical protein
MPIFQVKYNQGHYAYYLEECKECVKDTTTFHLSYIGVKEKNSLLEIFESTKLRTTLINFFNNENTRN